jgi:GTPase SAR1 family protein
MFYSGVDGVILVHDLTNIKSQENLKQWLTDVTEQNENISVYSSDLYVVSFFLIK